MDLLKDVEGSVTDVLKTDDVEMLSISMLRLLTCASVLAMKLDVPDDGEFGRIAVMTFNALRRDVMAIKKAGSDAGLSVEDEIELLNRMMQ